MLSFLVQIANALSWLAQVVTLLDLIRELTDLNIFRDTDCRHLGLSSFSSFLSQK
jgi:hypothetical protein